MPLGKMSGAEFREVFGALHTSVAGVNGFAGKLLCAELLARGRVVEVVCGKEFGRVAGVKSPAWRRNRWRLKSASFDANGF